MGKGQGHAQTEGVGVEMVPIGPNAATRLSSNGGNGAHGSLSNDLFIECVRGRVWSTSSHWFPVRNGSFVHCIRLSGRHRLEVNL